MDKYLEKFRGFIKTEEAALSPGEYQDLLSEISRECADRKGTLISARPITSDTFSLDFGVETGGAGKTELTIPAIS